MYCDLEYYCTILLDQYIASKFNIKYSEKLDTFVKRFTCCSTVFSFSQYRMPFFQYKQGSLWSDFSSYSSGLANKVRKVTIDYTFNTILFVYTRFDDVIVTLQMQSATSKGWRDMSGLFSDSKYEEIGGASAPINNTASQNSRWPFSGHLPNSSIFALLNNTFLRNTSTVTVVPRVLMWYRNLPSMRPLWKIVCL